MWPGLEIINPRPTSPANFNCLFSLVFDDFATYDECFGRFG